MQVQDIMTRDAAAAPARMNAAEAAELMWRGNCGALPVVTDGNRVIGIITDRDLFIALGTQNRKPAEVSVGEIMHANPFCCEPTDDLQQALSTMASQHVRRLPVVDPAGSLQGMLSVDDVMARIKVGFGGNGVVRTLKAICESQAKPQPKRVVLANQ